MGLEWPGTLYIDQFMPNTSAQYSGSFPFSSGSLVFRQGREMEIRFQTIPRICKWRERNGNYCWTWSLANVDVDVDVNVDFNKFLIEIEN